MTATIDAPTVAWPAELVDLIHRLAGWATRHADATDRADAVSAAVTAMSAAWVEGAVSDANGLATVALRAAWRAERASRYVCSESAACRVESSVAAVLRVDPHRWVGESSSTDGSESWPNAPGRVLSRLVSELVAAGLARSVASRAVEHICDLAGAQGLSAANNTSSAALAEATGLSAPGCRALLVLMLGQIRSRGLGRRHGLVARAALGEDVWSDPRVAALISEIARPTNRVLRNPWG